MLNARKRRKQKLSLGWWRVSVVRPGKQNELRCRATPQPAFPACLSPSRYIYSKVNRPSLLPAPRSLATHAPATLRLVRTRPCAKNTSQKKREKATSLGRADCIEKRDLSLAGWVFEAT